MHDDIDFPCSGLWNNYYADRGLTSIRHSTDPRRPAEPLPVRLRTMEEGRDRRLRTMITELLKPPPSQPRPLVTRPFRGGVGLGDA